MANCDGCTLCCELFEVKEMDSPAFEMCKRCDGKGCTIHPTRPQVCRDFECVYTRMEGSNIKTRPDKIGVVFEKPTDEMFHGTIRPNTELTDDAKCQIISFNKQGFTVFIKDSVNYKYYIAEGHEEEDMIKKLSRVSEERHGNC
jgi:Fe-S-cluster containining protein